MKFEDAEKSDPVNRPKHYTSHPSGIECIRITEHMNFCLGNAVKYIWRADEKKDALEDLRKAAWYIAREIERRERKSKRTTIGQPYYIYCGETRRFWTSKGPGWITNPAEATQFSDAECAAHCARSANIQRYEIIPAFL